MGKENERGRFEKRKGEPRKRKIKRKKRRKNWVLLFGLAKNTPTVLFHLGTLEKLSFFYLGTEVGKC